VTVNDNGFFTQAAVPSLTFIQRREDPMTDSSLTSRDVYGYYDNANIYRFTADSTLSQLSAVEKIALPTLGVFITTSRMIDIGMYQIVVYSEVNCNSIAGLTKITNPSAWFYTIASKTWTCVDLGNTPTMLAAAWATPTL
jgi:hypothetical protein